MERETITLIVTPEFKRGVRIAAANCDLSPSEFIRQAVAKQIEEGSKSKRKNKTTAATAGAD